MPGEGVLAPSYFARLYKPRMPLFWWLSKPSYTAFVLRELSSVFVAWFVAYLLLLARAVGTGEAEFQQFLDLSARPWMIALNVVALLFVLYHAITFINLTPQAMVLKVRGRTVPGGLITVGVYASWLVVSAILAWLVVG
jgi:fumarate reductase subunit C